MPKPATLKAILKQSDNVDIPMNPDFYHHLHMKIMNEVVKTEIQPPPGRLRTYPTRKSWRDLVGLKK